MRASHRDQLHSPDTGAKMGTYDGSEPNSVDPIAYLESVNDPPKSPVTIQELPDADAVGAEPGVQVCYSWWIP